MTCTRTVHRRALLAAVAATFTPISSLRASESPFRDVVIRHGDQRWTVTAKALAAAVASGGDGTAITPEPDPDRVKELLQPIADDLHTAPVNAVVGWNGGLFVIEDAHPGQVVDLDTLADRVIRSATGGDSVVRVPFTEVEADVHAGNLDTLGITSELGRGDSSFAGSSWERAENVRVGARNVDQTLIPPRSTFSFNASLGPITPDMGYVEGKIIRAGWFQGDIGGGVCQVSTTVYRATFFAGLPVTEWHPHSFRLDFYELNGWPPGIDAAIYQPNTDDETAMDLTFTNPFDHWLLLQLELEGDTLRAAIYGPETGYTVDAGDPYISDPIQPDGPVEQPDPELAPGERVQVQSAKPGYNVEIERVVTRDGELISRDWFKSWYRPQRETWAVGTQE